MQSTASNHFAATVRACLLANKLEGRKPDSIRGLARTLGNGEQVRSETWKRSLFKWMANGTPNPSPESRAFVARALGVEAQELADPDDEEDDLVAVLARAIRRVVREEMQREHRHEVAP